MRLSANLGFLWTELPLPDAIRAAAKAGFVAVECHFPYDVYPEHVNAALLETGLPMIGLNTIRGDGLGLSALVDRELYAQAAIDQAIDYAAKINTKMVHVMAGIANGQAAHETFLRNLRYALKKAAPHNITLLIEPLSSIDNPGYFLRTTAQAVGIIAEIDDPNLKLMFDCYHVQVMQGDICRRLENLLPVIGHIQIAAVPDRGEPDAGELDYRHILQHIDKIGYDGYVGAEYRPRTSTDAGLSWMRTICA